MQMPCRLVGKTVFFTFSKQNVPLKHGCMFEHIWQNDKDNFRSPQVNLIGLALDAIGVRHDGILNVEIHHVFGLKEETTDELAFSCFDRNNSTLGIMQQDNGDSNPVISHNRHGEAVNSLLFVRP